MASSEAAASTCAAGFASHYACEEYTMHACFNKICALQSLNSKQAFNPDMCHSYDVTRQSHTNLLMQTAAHHERDSE